MQYPAGSLQDLSAASPAQTAFLALTTLPVTAYVPRTGVQRVYLPIFRQGVPAVSLVDAVEGRLDGLDGANEHTFGAEREKMRFAVLVPGYKPFFQQKNIYIVKKGQAQPIPWSKVIQLSAQVVDKFFTKVSSTIMQGVSPRFGSGLGELRREDMYILALDVYGSTVQVILAHISHTSSPGHGVYVASPSGWPTPSTSTGAVEAADPGYDVFNSPFA